MKRASFLKRLLGFGAATVVAPLHIMTPPERDGRTAGNVRRRDHPV